MNTFEKGDRFENEAYNMITEKLRKGSFAFTEKNARVFKKKAYFSRRRNKDIIFDLSIEIWPADAKNYIQVFLIECKDHNDPVKISDAETLAARVSDVADLNGKAILISRNPFPTTVVEFATNTGMMLIEMPSKKKSHVVVHREERKFTPGFTYEEKVLDFLKQALILPIERVGLGDKYPRLSKVDIQKVVAEFSAHLGMSGLNVRDQASIDRVLLFLEKEKGIRVEFVDHISPTNNRKVLGSFDASKMLIRIDKSIVGSERFAFVLMHEIGHAILHADLDIDQSVYNSYQDASYDFMIGKFRLDNAKNWIEWHANYFASMFLLPDEIVAAELIRIQRACGISRLGYVYLDDQKANRADFKRTLIQLSQRFSVTRTSITYRLNEMGLIKYAGRSRSPEHVSRVLFEVVSEWDEARTYSS